MLMTKEEFQKIIGKELAKERKQKGISQQQVIDETGINISRIEAYRQCPGMYCFYCLCEYLRISPICILERILSHS